MTATWSQQRVGENYLQNPVGIAWPKLAGGNYKSDLFVSGSAKSANDASVFRIKYSDPQQSTVPVTLSGSSPGPIAVTETSLYYFDSAKQMLLKKAVDPDKSTPEPIVSGVLNLKGMAGYNDRLYYVDGDRIGMWKPGSGTQPQYVIQGLDHPKSIDVDRYGYLYVSISGKAAGGTS
ncbi:MAG TPA: hypothetical protein VIT23_13570, partial [Terrimicrobiaceae bacterium]